jgi:molybdate transport system substrate-binding protein
MKSSSIAAAVASASVLTLVSLGLDSGAARAAEIKVLSAVVMQSALDDVVRDYERATGNKVTVAYAPAGGIRERIQGGEAFDVAVLPRPAIEQLVKQGALAATGSAVVGRSAVSVCVRAGAPAPDIGSADALRRTLLSSKSVAYSDPAKGGASGVHFARVIERLGIAEEMKTRAKLTGPDSAEYVARGEAEMCVTQAMEILRTAGVVVAGNLPAELQNTTDFVFAAGIASASREPAAAQGLVRHLRTPESARVIKSKGMEPGDL